MFEHCILIYGEPFGWMLGSRPVTTHDAVSHQVTARRHPGGHRGSLYKWTELGISEHEVDANDRAIRSIACRRRSVVEPPSRPSATCSRRRPRRRQDVVVLCTMF